MNVSVLGGRGFIGSHLARALADAGHVVTVMDRLGRADGRASDPKKIRFLPGDFLRSTDVAAAIEGADVVVHLVSLTVPGTASQNPVYDLETNVIGSVRLFERCVATGVRKVVFISSGGTVYGIPRSLPIGEDHALDPINTYGLSKLVIEKYLGIYRHQRGLDHAILRLSNPYGEGQRPDTGQGVIASWVHRAFHREAVEIWGDGSVVRDYVYIGDVVKALVSAVEASLEAKVLNIGSGVGHSLLQIHGLLERVIGRRVPIVFKEGRSVDVPANALDVSLAARTIGWRPETTLEDGLTRLWHQVNR